MAPSSSKCCPQVAHKRFATLEWHFLRPNFTFRVAHKKGVLRLAVKSATVLHRMYDQISKSPSTRLASKVQTQGPEDQDEGPEDQGTEDQGTRGPRDQRTKGPKNQRTRGTKGPGDQGSRGPRDQRTKRPADQDQRSRGSFIFDTNYFLIGINFGINFLFDGYPLFGMGASALRYISQKRARN